MIHVDGSFGEGGGQVLRTALALSLVTGQPFTIDRIRAGRAEPGLKRQHLTAVLAAAEIGNATVHGAELGSSWVSFEPRRVRAGDYRFAVGTAGSTTLVFQTVWPALLAAEGPSSLTLSGGTHNPMAPPFDFLARTFAPAVRRMGASLDLQLVRHGFAPAGGGMFTASTGPARLVPTEILQREPAGLRRARVLLSRLSRDIAERELAVVRERLDFHPEQLVIEEVDAPSPGNMLLLELPYTHLTEVIAEPGERGVTAERVAKIACNRALAYLATDAPVGEHLADQLLLPMALAGGGVFRTLEPSLHTRTNAQVIERFLPVLFSLREDERAGTWIVEARAT